MRFYEMYFVRNDEIKMLNQYMITVLCVKSEYVYIIWIHKLLVLLVLVVQ